VFNLSGTEIIVILLLALVILGPEKLPEAMRKAGRAYSELRKMANSFQSEVKSVLDEPMEELRGTADAIRDATNFSGDTKKPTKSSPGPPGKPAVAATAVDPEAVAAADPEPATVDDLFDDDEDVDDRDGGDGAGDDVITRTLSGDVAPHDPTGEAGPPGPPA
jgi:sec-independent protein translocase protein TatB